MLQENLVGLDVGSQELVTAIKRKDKMYPVASIENTVRHRKFMLGPHLHA